MSLVRSPVWLVLGLVLGGWAAMPALAAASAVSAIPLPAPSVLTLAPGVTYQRAVLAGGQVVHIIRIAPDGLATIDPVVVSGAVARRGDLARATRALAPSGAVASVNGDFFNFNQAYPSGLTITRSAGLVSTPDAPRSSLTIAPAGGLSLVRPVLDGSWVPIAADGSTSASAGKIAGIDRPAVHASEVILFTPGYGPAIAPLPAHLPAGVSGRTPTTEDSTTIVPDAPGPLEPNQTVTGTVVANSGTRAVRIPAGDLVLTGIGAAAGAIAARLPVGTRVSLDARIAGIAPGTLALGGGPALVVAGHAVHNAGEGFVAGQLRPALGADRDRAGGRRHRAAGVRRGPRSGQPRHHGAPAGGSDGPARRPHRDRDGLGREQPDDRQRCRRDAVGAATRHQHRGGRALRRCPSQPARGPLSPNGDGVDDRASVPVIVPSPGTLSVTLSAARRPMITLLDRAVPAIPVALSIDPVRLGIPDGTYRLTASLTTLTGAVSRDSQVVVVDRTLGSLRTRALVRRRQPEEQVGFRLARAAAVSVRVTTRSGRVLAVLLGTRGLAAGSHSLTWNQHEGKRIVSGGVDIVVQATTRAGTHGLIAATGLLRPPRRTTDPRGGRVGCPRSATWGRVVPDSGGTVAITRGEADVRWRISPSSTSSRRANCITGQCGPPSTISTSSSSGS